MLANNNCKKLLKNVKLIQELLVSENIPDEAFDFIQNFKNFRNVVNSCISNNLSPDFYEHIHAFFRSFFVISNHSDTKVPHVILPCDIIHKALLILAQQFMANNPLKNLFLFNDHLTRFTMNASCPNSLSLCRMPQISKN